MGDSRKSVSIEDVLTDEDRRRLDDGHKAVFDDDVQADDPDPEDGEDE